MPPDLVRKLFFWPISASHFKEENGDEGQQDEDEEKRTHHGADNDGGPGWELERAREPM